jgi:small subunit ribosomal protein S18
VTNDFEERRGGRDRDRDRDRGDDGDRERRPRRGARRRGCEFCQRHVDVVDYKDLNTLRHYVTERGKIDSRRKVGTCAKHQRAVSQAIKRARHMALLPFTSEHVRVTGVAVSRR